MSERLELRRQVALIVMLTDIFVTILDSSIVNVAIPSIRSTLGASFAEAELVAGYAFTFAIGLITGGRLGDIFGQRRMFLVGFTAFTLTSALVANVGAANTARALRASWVGVLIAALMAETIGLAAARWPAIWLGLFTSDPTVLAIPGPAYLRTVGPCFGFYGLGYALCCAGQGTGRMEWPVTGALVRAGIAIAGGELALRYDQGLSRIFLAAACGMAVFGCLSLPGLALRIGYGRPRT